MPTLVSSALGVDRKRLEKLGVFNGFVDIDCKLYVDPFLLASARTPELKNAEQSFKQHFIGVLKLLKASVQPNDVFMKEATERLTFPEVGTAGLGFATAGRGGSGIGPELADKLAITARAIVKAGLEDPDIFQLAGLFQDNIAADRISDMTIRLIFPHLAAFSERVGREVEADLQDVTFGGVTYRLPYHKKSASSFLLIPTELLRSLPVAHSWSDVDQIAAENDALRHRVNQKIGDTWKEATRDHSKKELREALLENPELVADLLEQYHTKDGRPYDLKKDPEGHVVWLDLAEQLVASYPLPLSTPKQFDSAALLELVKELCDHFATLIEDNGVARLLWSEGGQLRHESFAQLLFYTSASLYCDKANVDISPESDAGRGPVDFKFSRGSAAKVTVEVKYSRNSVRHGYETQLPIYNRAERTQHSVLLVLRVTASRKQIKEVLELRREALDKGKRAPDLIEIDARLKPSASKA